MRKTSGRVAVWVLALLPLLLVGALYTKLPAQVPMRWGFGGQVEYGEKWNLLIVAAVAPLSAVMLALVPRIDPKRRNYEKFSDSYLLFQIWMMGFLLVLVCLVLVETFYPGTVDMSRVVILLLAALLLTLGNMMPKFRPNFFCGIKTPWTLSSDTVWTKTHRLGGRMMFASGVCMLLTLPLPETARFVLLFALLVLAVLTPSVMSYIWFRKEQARERS